MAQALRRRLDRAIRLAGLRAAPASLPARTWTEALQQCVGAGTDPRLFAGEDAVSGVNFQKVSREELMQTLRNTLAEAIEFNRAEAFLTHLG